MKVLTIDYTINTLCTYVAGEQKTPFQGQHDVTAYRVYNANCNDFFSSDQEAALSKAPFDLIFTDEDWAEYTRPLLDKAIALSTTSTNKPVVIGPTKDISWIEVIRSRFKQACAEIDIATPKSTTYESLQDAITAIPDLPEQGYVVKVEDISQDFADRLFTILTQRKKSAEAFLRYAASEQMKAYHPDYRNQFPVMLEERLDAAKYDEISVGAFFNGKRFIEPFHYHIEYKRVAAGDVGANVIEPGAHMIKIEDQASHKLVQVFKRFESTLKDKFVGYFDVNFFVSKDSDEVFAIECDCRFPSPAGYSLHQCFQEGDYIKFLHELGHGTEPTWNTPKYMLSLRVASLGFPIPRKGVLPGYPIFGLKEHIAAGSMYANEVEFEEEHDEYVIASNLFIGSLFVALGNSNSSTQQAKADLYSRMTTIDCPYVVYRNDIGDKRCSASFLGDLRF